MKCSISFLLFALTFIVGVYAPPTTTVSPIPVVSINNSKDMTAGMQLEAVDAFKRAYVLSSNIDRCRIVKEIFTEKYPLYKWHVAMYKAYSIQSIKRIDVTVNHDKFVLYATKK